MSCSAGTNAAVLPKLKPPIHEFQPLLGRTLVLVAHPDDETACAALLQRAELATVLFCTDGAPASDYFWRSYPSRREYARVRSLEAKQSLAIVRKSPEFLRHPQSHDSFTDQELYQNLTGAFTSLVETTQSSHLDAILAPAYEGGHPDHDACCFLAHLLGRTLAVPVWEMPLYHRGQNGELVHQKFLQSNGTEILVPLTPRELAKRRAMFAAYASQPDASDFVSSAVELYRPQFAYDFARAPHVGKLNYETWCWPMTGTQLCDAFQACLQVGLRKDLAYADKPGTRVPHPPHPSASFAEGWGSTR
jgi:LmbE family N-acetylglucosaminyl deacetylase